MKKTGMLFTVVLLAVFMGSVAVRGNVQHILWHTNGTTGDVDRPAAGSDGGVSESPAEQREKPS